MRILDLDMDYFMKAVVTSIGESTTERLPEIDYGTYVWTAEEVHNFLENNLGLSKENKIKGRIVSGHNEALWLWKELIHDKRLTTPFEVVHVDSHADLGLGYSSWTYILNSLLSYPPEERPSHPRYIDCFGKVCEEGIGDYLLFAIAYRWISKIIYCGNPCGDCNDYLWDTLKGFNENYIWDDPVENTIQLLHNPEMDFPQFDDSLSVKQKYIDNSKKEPDVSLLIIPTIEDVNFDGKFDFAVLAQSPNYTPESADFIINIFREYITEI